MSRLDDHRSSGTKRAWVRFSVRALLGVTALCAALLGWSLDRRHLWSRIRQIELRAEALNQEMLQFESMGAVRGLTGDEALRRVRRRVRAEERSKAEARREKRDISAQ